MHTVEYILQNFVKIFSIIYNASIKFIPESPYAIFIIFASFVISEKFTVIVIPMRVLDLAFYFQYLVLRINITALENASLSYCIYRGIHLIFYLEWIYSELIKRKTFGN